MAGVKALRRIQIGSEGETAGGAQAATFIWRGLGVIKDQEEVIFPEENVGFLGGTTRSYIARYWAEMSMPEVEATFEQLPYLFEAGVQSQTPAVIAGTTPSGYAYSYAAPTTQQNTTRTYTIEGGDDQQAEEFSYGFVKQITLSGEGQGALFMSAEWVGQHVTNCSFTTPLTPPSVEEILVNNAVLYIDSTTIGQTTVSNTLFGLNLNWTTGLKEYWACDGSKDFTITKQTGDEIVLGMTFEHNAAAVTQKATWRNNEERLVRLKFTGTDLTTEGETYDAKTLQIDLAGVWEDWSVLDERDGNDVVEATLRVRYGQSVGSSIATCLKAEVVIVNENSTLD